MKQLIATRRDSVARARRRQSDSHRQEHRCAAKRIDDRQQRRDRRAARFRRSDGDFGDHEGDRTKGRRAARARRAALRYTNTPDAACRARRFSASMTPTRSLDRFPRGRGAPAPAAGVGARDLPRGARRDARTRDLVARAEAARCRDPRSSTTRASASSPVPIAIRAWWRSSSQRRVRHARRRLRYAGRAGAGAGARRRDRSAQSRRLPAQRRRVRRAGGRRAEGPGGRAQCDGSKGRERRRRHRPADHGDQPRARAAGPQGERRVDSRCRCRRREPVRRRRERPGGVGARGRGRRIAPANPRTLRPHRRHSARRQRREPQRFGGERHLSLCDAARPQPKT